MDTSEAVRCGQPVIVILSTHVHVCERYAYPTAIAEIYISLSTMLHVQLTVPERGQLAVCCLYSSKTDCEIEHFHLGLSSPH